MPDLSSASLTTGSSTWAATATIDADLPPGDERAALLTAALDADTTGPKSTALYVVANHDRWVVECPDCHGAQVADPVDRRFLCNTCVNASCDGQWRPVIWPKNWLAIDAELALRLLPEHRNWYPGETLKDLRQEHAEHAGAEADSNDDEDV